MGCQSTKCKSCPTVMKACQLVQGMCPSCYSKQQAINNPSQPRPI